MDLHSQSRIAHLGTGRFGVKGSQDVTVLDCDVADELVEAVEGLSILAAVGAVERVGGGRVSGVWLCAQGV